MVFSGVKEQIISFPKGRLYWEFFMDGTRYFQNFVGNYQDVLSTKSDEIVKHYYVSDICSWFDVNLPQNFPSLQIILQDRVKSSNDKLIFLWAAEES